MKKNITAITVFWVLLILGSFSLNYLIDRQNQRAVAFQTAKSFFNQIVLTRSWNAAHGGVYVPVTAKTRPNPYLNDPRRDLQIESGFKLTKINPAFMTRQIAEMASRWGQVRFRITSLKPIRPENEPTLREKKALLAFENGADEIGEFFQDETGRGYFYMAPLKTESHCLQCHARQGYREGDVRGGISITLPFIPKIPLLALGLGHLFLGLAGVFGIILGGVKLNRAYESLRDQAVLDSLTGIPNRRGFTERILLEYGRSRREKYPLALIMGDIDYFKSYNDSYGHKNGDECLKLVATEIKNGLKRPDDFCARFGGEEFIAILPRTDRTGAAVVAEAIRSRIQGLGLPHKNSPVSGVVTISLGVAVLDVQAPLYYEDLINAADQALYRAKQEGRNRVAVWEGGQPEA